MLYSRAELLMRWIAKTVPLWDDRIAFSFSMKNAAIDRQRARNGPSSSFGLFWLAMIRKIAKEVWLDHLSEDSRLSFSLLLLRKYCVSVDTVWLCNMRLMKMKFVLKELYSPRSLSTFIVLSRWSIILCHSHSLSLRLNSGKICIALESERCSSRRWLLFWFPKTVLGVVGKRP